MEDEGNAAAVSGSVTDWPVAERRCQQRNLCGMQQVIKTSAAAAAG
ncbi:MAG: hypothetical protein R3B96_03760 [Pirellulaceae bacterium]